MVKLYDIYKITKQNKTKTTKTKTKTKKKTLMYLVYCILIQKTRYIDVFLFNADSHTLLLSLTFYAINRINLQVSLCIEVLAIGVIYYE